MANAKGKPRIRSPNAKGRSRCLPPYVKLELWVLRSAAYDRASLAARCLLVELMALYNGRNNGDVWLSVRDAAARLHCGKDRAQRAFAELECLGFIQVNKRGSFHLKVRHATTWTITLFPVGDEPATKDFMRLDIQNTVPATGTDGTRHRDRGRIRRVA